MAGCLLVILIPVAFGIAATVAGGMDGPVFYVGAFVGTCIALLLVGHLGQ